MASAAAALDSGGSVGLRIISKSLLSCTESLGAREESFDPPVAVVKCTLVSSIVRCRAQRYYAPKVCLRQSVLYPQA